MTELKGYGGSAVEWDGTKLIIRATNGRGRVALFGQAGAAGQDKIELTRDQVENVEYKPGTAMITNGIMKVKIVDQKRPIQIHFLRKYRKEFADLARDLGAALG